MDVLSLTPHSQVTGVHEVPCTKLTIFADAAGGKGTDGLDVLIYGIGTKRLISMEPPSK